MIRIALCSAAAVLDLFILKAGVCIQWSFEGVGH